MLKKLACIGLGVMIVITLGGCGKENKISEHDKDVIFGNDSGIEEVNKVEKNLLTKEDILGHWEIEKATYKSSGKELPLQELYGTGISYGGGVDFFEDGTSSEEIGITSGEGGNSEITYTIEQEIIKVRVNGKVIREYEYVETENKICLRSLRNDFSEEYYLYFEREHDEILPEVKTLSETDERVKKLYEYLSETELIYPTHGNIGNTNKLLSNKEKIYIAYSILYDEVIEYDSFADATAEGHNVKILDNNKAERFYGTSTEIETISKNKNPFWDKNGYYLIRFPEKVVYEKVKEIFGTDVAVTSYDEIWLEDLTAYYNGAFYKMHSVERSGERFYDMYYAEPNGVKEDLWHGNHENFSCYRKAEQVGENIIIYDYYATCSDYNLAAKTSNDVENNLFNVSISECDGLLQNNTWTEKLKQKAGKYKHTFKKDASGNYYWYASEMID